MSKKNRHKYGAHAYRQHLLRQNAAKSLIRLAQPSDESGKEVFAYQSELDYISRCILSHPNIETGGQLFGFYASKGTPVICYAIGPGLHANHQVTFFNQDLDYLQSIGTILNQEFGLQHIGEWHSHHRLGLAYPSGHDVQTMHHSIDDMHLGQFLLCIGSLNGCAANINAFAFYENDPSYYPAPWHIKATPSPYRQVIDERLCDLLVHPLMQEPRLSGMHISRISVAKDANIYYLLRAYHTKPTDL